LCVFGRNLYQLIEEGLNLKVSSVSSWLINFILY